MYYEGIGPERGKRVSGEDAPAYAMVRCGIGRMQDTPETPEFLTALWIGISRATGSGGRVIRMIPDRGVDFYITGTEIVEVHFPNGDLACQWCPFCKRKTFRGNTRVICVKTYEPLNEIYETRRGDDCPLAIQEVDT